LEKVPDPHRAFSSETPAKLIIASQLPNLSSLGPPAAPRLFSQRWPKLSPYAAAPDAQVGTNGDNLASFRFQNVRHAHGFNFLYAAGKPLQKSR
jgi:hypothetical protein